MIVELQRKVEVWIAERYDIEEYNEDILSKMLKYEMDEIPNIDPIWETQDDLGPYMVIDVENNKVIDEG